MFSRTFAVFTIFAVLGVASSTLLAKEPISLSKTSIPIKKEIHRIEAHQDHVRAVAFSPDSQLALTGGEDAMIFLWEAATGKKIGGFKGHSHWISSLAFVPHQNRFLSGSYDSTVRLWAIGERKEVARMEGNPGIVTCLAVDPTGRQGPAAGLVLSPCGTFSRQKK